MGDVSGCIADKDLLHASFCVPMQSQTDMLSAGDHADQLPWTHGPHAAADAPAERQCALPSGVDH